MHVDPSHSVPSLRLVRPGASPPPSPPQQQPSAAHSADPFRFESAYLSKLPRPELSDAHRRLDRIRELVAGRTGVPIHFEQPRARPANPYALSYERAAGVDPAQRNAEATRDAGGRPGD